MDKLFKKKSFIILTFFTLLSCNTSKSSVKNNTERLIKYSFKKIKACPTLIKMATLVTCIAPLVPVFTDRFDFFIEKQHLAPLHIQKLTNKIAKIIPKTISEKTIYNIVDRIFPLKVYQGRYENIFKTTKAQAFFEPSERFIYFPKNSFTKNKRISAEQFFSLTHEICHSTQTYSIYSSLFKKLILKQKNHFFGEADANERTMLTCEKLKENKGLKPMKIIFFNALKSYEKNQASIELHKKINKSIIKHNKKSDRCLSPLPLISQTNFLEKAAYFYSNINAYIKSMDKNKENEKGRILKKFFDQAIKTVIPEIADEIKNWKIGTVNETFNKAKKDYKNYIERDFKFKTITRINIYKNILKKTILDLKTRPFKKEDYSKYL
ncbi:hypothetical protein KAH94_03135 [bacterium]|nr:hypothetical protein [bacterium]